MKKILLALPLISTVALADNPGLVETLSGEAETQIASVASSIGPVLVAAFGIAVAFVAYKLIKRALNRA